MSSGLVRTVVIIAVAVSTVAACVASPEPPSRTGGSSPAPAAAGVTHEPTGVRTQPTPVRENRSTGWTQVRTDGVVLGLLAPRVGAGIIVVGVRADGGALVAGVRGSWATLLSWAPTLRPRSELATVTSDGENIYFATRTRAGAGELPQIWSADAYLDQLEVMNPRLDPLPRDPSGRAPVWVRPLVDGEEDYRVVGIVRHPGALPEVVAWDQQFTPDPVVGGHLYLHDDPLHPTLQVGNTEVDVIVAGLLSTDSGHAAKVPTLWVGDEGIDHPGRWSRLPLTPEPDHITDIADWEVGFWAAGAYHGRPVLYSFDQHTGRMPAPATELDARRPSVLFATKPPYPADRPIIATQSVDGPTVWVPVEGRYVRVPAPAGRLDAAGVHDDLIYVVVDGALWVRQLPAGAAPTV